MTDSIGKTIKRLRKEKNLTQEALAEQLNVSPQAVSKWENESGLPDISQIIPLASVFGVSTDVLFGIEGTAANDEALKIIQKASAIRKYGNRETYLSAYDKLIEGLKKYPNNLILLNHCMQYGLALALPENGYLYASERAKEIAAETIRQAKLIISYSQNLSDIMAARQALVLLYSSAGNYDQAIAEAESFPVRTDFTFFSQMAYISEYRGDDAHTVTYLCSNMDYSLQALEDNAARLGKAYYSSGKYEDAIDVYETFLNVLKVIFKDNCPPPYHDFDSGDCYILLAQAYLMAGDTDRAMNSVENSIQYYLNLLETCKDDHIPFHLLMNTSFVKESEIRTSIPKSAIIAKLNKKLSAEEISPLRVDKRFQKLYEKVCSLGESSCLTDEK